MLAFVVSEEDAGQRLDTALAAASGVTRSQACRWLDAGLVRLNDAPARASRRVRTGDVIEASPPDPVPSTLVPEPIPLAVLHEDADLIVVDKPAGLVVHPAPGHRGGTLVNALLHHCDDLAGIGGVLRPGIVHRLDRGTSGVLVAAKNDAAHRALAEQFHDHSIERMYLALVRGTPGEDAGRIDRPIGRHHRDRKRMSVRTRVGREARTRWRILERFARSERSWIEVRPETGRTHQIRVHLASVGMPIAADPSYGRARGGRRLATPAERELGRPALHAALLAFAHPRGGETMRFEAPLPGDLTGLLEELARRERAR